MQRGGPDPDPPSTPIRVHIRPERADEAATIRALHDTAFGEPLEGAIVDGIRGTADWVEGGSLVAEDTYGHIVGHVLASRGVLTSASDARPAIWMLGPIAVRPDRQGAGIGSVLMRAIIERATERGVALMCLLGDAGYYARFGFVAARGLGIEPPDVSWTDDHWLALALPGWTAAVTGVAGYPSAFGV